MPLPQTFGRTRTLVTPDFESGSNVILGKFYKGIQVGGVYTGTYSSLPESTVVYDYRANRLWVKAKVTMDTVHKAPYRSGDAFSCLKYVWCTPYSGVYGSGTYDRADKAYRYVGGFHPPGEFSPLGVSDRFNFKANSIAWLLRTVENTNHPSMLGLGDMAWKRTKPKLQKADAAVFTSELRDLPSMLKQTAKRYDQIWRRMGGSVTSMSRSSLRKEKSIMHPKSVANDFLAQQFGWVPFVKDLIKFDDVVQNYHDIIARSIDRNDRWVRRRVPISSVEETTVIRQEQVHRMFPFLMNDSFFASPPVYDVREVKQTTVSAVGKFRYYRPEFDKSVQDQLSQWNQAQQFLTVSGFRITPSNLYNAFPWTWAIDWFANVGDWVDDLNDTWIDNIVSEYCFVMQHQRTIRRATQWLPFHSGTLAFEFEREIESKQRHKATSPYDFSLSWGNLTPRQLAIAAALGIGRFPNFAR